MSTLADAVSAALREAELAAAAAEQEELELTEAERWARDPIGWINEFVWVASKFAGKRGRVRPMRMLLYPDQRRTIDEWIDLEHLAETGEPVFRNIVIEKSRQIGETWLFAAVICWALHYHPVTGLAIHTKLPEIADRGFTVKSLFGRVKFIDQRLVAAHVPGVVSRLRFYPPSADQSKIVNETNGATVHGEPRSDNPGRGGTFDFILVDEAAFVPHGEAVYAAIDEACPEGKALLSTVNGADNFHARIADEEPAGWRYLRLHWSTHPVYSTGVHVAALPPGKGERAGRHAEQPTAAMRQAAEACALCAGVIRGERWNSRTPRAHRFPGKLASPYYDRAVIGKTAEQVASELDIDREGSLKARVYDEFSSALHVSDEPISYDVRLPVELAFDYGLDVTSVVVCQDAPDEYRVIGEVELVDKPGETPTPDNVSRALLEELLQLGVDPDKATPYWTRKMFARGDPSGANRSLDTGRSVVSTYRAHGFEIGSPPRHLTGTVAPSITAVKQLLLGNPKPLRVSSRCQRFIRHMRHNRWPVDTLGNRRLGVTVPSDDEHNHMMRAFAYLVVSKFPPQQGSVQYIDDPWTEEAESPYGSLLDDARPLGYDSAG